MENFTVNSRGATTFLKLGDQPMASAVAQACNGGLGAVPPVESRGKAPGRGVRGRSPLKLTTFLHYWCIFVR